MRQKEFSERLFAGETVEGESKGIHRDGREIYTWFRVGPIFRGGELAGIIGTIKDITERKRAEE